MMENNIKIITDSDIISFSTFIHNNCKGKKQKINIVFDVL